VYTAVKSARLIKGARDIYYPGAPHGIAATHQDQINAELLALLQSWSRSAPEAPASTPLCNKGRGRRGRTNHRA
jgi:hypothetical protein